MSSLPSAHSFREVVNRLQEQVSEHETKVAIPTDPVEFCKNVLKFTPTDYQEKFLRDTNQFIALRWSRQSGKSFIVSARLLWQALINNGINVAIVSPSYRQSRLVLRKVAGWIGLIPRELRSTAGKTRIEFTNGSSIEAFPDNPLTIRGPTLHLVYCDEMNFIRDDVDLYDAILFTIGTTNGSFIASSTPGSRDGLFYKIAFAPEYSDFSRYHVSWREAVEPRGPLKAGVIDKIRKQLETNPWRWTREMEAEFAEDEDSFFPLALVTGCVDGELEYAEFESKLSNRLIYIGVDFGKHRDHSVVAAIDYDNESKNAKLIHMHRFPLESEYASVIGYVKALASRWGILRRVSTDVTGVGDFITEEMKKSGLPQTEGVLLTIQSKTDILGNLKQMMQTGRLSMPFDSELVSEMNSERYELLKSGQMQFSHPEDQHDDRLWALALACYGIRFITEIPHYKPAIAFGKIIKPKWQVGSSWSTLLPRS
jgi:phage FluMu gp28-like protein